MQRPGPQGFVELYHSPSEASAAPENQMSGFRVHIDPDARYFGLQTVGNQSESTYSSQQGMNMHKQDLSHLRQVADLLTTGSFSLVLGSLTVTHVNTYIELTHTC